MPRSNCRAGFFILGARKGGSTSLYNYITSHPLIDPLINKPRTSPSYGEVHFLHKPHKRGFDWYKNLYRHVPPNHLTGESSVSSLVSFYAPLNAKYYCGDDIRMLVVLREPVKRMHSQFMMRLRLGTNNVGVNSSFAVWASEQFEAFEKNKMDALDEWKDFNETTKHFPPSMNALYEGMYVFHLKRWFAHYPRDSIRVLIFEDFYSTPEVTARELSSIYEFLGVDSSLVDIDSVVAKKLNTEGTNHRVQYKPDPKYNLTPALETMMKSYFKPYNLALEQLLGKKLPASWYH